VSAGLSGVSLLRFGAFELDLRTGELRKAGSLISLPPQPFRILALLASHAGQLVTREEIQRQIWGSETFVDFERGLNFAINKIRKALGDDAETPRYIETLARRGYRFVAPVENVGSPLEPPGLGRVRADPESPTEPEGAGTGIATAPSAPPPGVRPPSTQGRRAMGVGISEHPQSSTWTVRNLLLPEDWPLRLGGLLAMLLVGIGVGWLLWHRSMSQLGRAPKGRIQSLAVLPLENLSGDKEQQYFADGMTEALITDLGKVSALRVISRTSTMQYRGAKKPLPQIARDLNVDAVVEGAILRSGDRVRITAQLIQARTERHLWAEAYERNMRDILALQSEVARDITNEIQIKLTPQEQAHLASVHPVNPQAYEAYLRGRFYLEKWTGDGASAAIGYFQEATRIDPKYAEAYAGLAESYATFTPLPPSEAIPKARIAVAKALELDEKLAEAHASLAIIRFFHDWDWSGAEREFKRAIELNPNYGEAHHFYSHYLMAMGRTADSLAESQRNLELDPLSPAPNLHLGWHYLFARQYDQAIEQERKTLQMDPNYVQAHDQLGRAYEQKGMYQEAVAEFRRAVTLSGEETGSLVSLAHAYAVSGQKAEAKKLLVKLNARSKRGDDWPSGMAELYAGFGDKDKAFHWLEKGYEERDTGMALLLKASPRLDPVRSDRRFQSLLHRAGLSENPLQ
jgi:TolB-like protein/DNA-binding winged helix-turn-helix (wHTH) protein/tetratricopeptide (TPR) repeat protein